MSVNRFPHWDDYSNEVALRLHTWPKHGMMYDEKLSSGGGESMTKARVRAVCEHVYMLAVCFFLLWDVFYMTEADWTFAVRGAFSAVWCVLAVAAALLGRFRLGWLYLPAGLLVWMGAASVWRGQAVLDAQLPSLMNGVLAFLVILPAAWVVERERFRAWLKVLLGLWTACFTLQSVIGLWAALTGHAVFSLRGTWYIGLNLGDNRLYLNAYVTTAAVKLGLSVLLTVLLAALCRRRWSRLLCGGCAVLQMLCLSLTDCRTAFIALGVTLGLGATVLLWRLPKWTNRALWQRMAAMALAVLLLTAGAYAALTGALSVLGPHVPRELDNITLTELPAHLLPSAAAEEVGVAHRALEADTLFNNRQHIWKAALRLLGDQPEFLLTGTTSVMAKELTNFYLLGETDLRYDHVHSIYLQTLVSWGVPGLLLLAACLAVFGFAAYRVMLRRPLTLWQRLAPLPVLYVLLCDTVDCFTRLSAVSPMLLFACLFAGLTLTQDKEVRL